jgi:hypothetical protein
MAKPDVLTGVGREPVHYRIVVRGIVGRRFVAPLDVLSIESAGHESSLLCLVRDQAELHSVLAWLFERGIEIISVNPLPSERAFG